jgi:hypothetical protein
VSTSIPQFATGAIVASCTEVKFENPHQHPDKNFKELESEAQLPNSQRFRKREIGMQFQFDDNESYVTGFNLKG